MLGETNGNTNPSGTNHPGISETTKPDPKISPYPRFPSSVSTHISSSDIAVQKHHYNNKLSSFADLHNTLSIIFLTKTTAVFLIFTIYGLKFFSNVICNVATT